MGERTAAVVIGRNEGDRLRRCLASLCDPSIRTVYVDSGSCDGSVGLAESMGAIVVELDAGAPFTAARARNAGFAAVEGAYPGIEFVHFVDGDCEVVPGWVARAERELETRPRTAVVCGRRRERNPAASIYNRLCDMEWDTPIGPAKACGGDAMIRAEAFREAGGYNAAMIAGEEPELCVRLRRRGWTIVRLDADMTLHDAQMSRFGQWWNRSLRAGHAFAEGAALHGRSPERHWVHEARSAWLWGLVLPLVTFTLAPATRGMSLLLLGAYGVLFARVYRGRRRLGATPDAAGLYALFCVLGKLPQALGQVLYRFNRLARRRAALIEYKGAERPSARIAR